MVRINGEEKDVAGQTVSECLSACGFNSARVVVELNEKILPKASYAETVLQNGDSAEVVCFMGGG